MEKLKQNKGITLIALVITIIVMLILVAVTITMAVNGGLFDYASRAARETNEVMEQERELANIRGNMTTDELIAYYTNGGSGGTGGSVTRYAVTQAVQALPAYSSSLLNNNGVLTENAKYEDGDGNVAPMPAGFKVSSVATEQKVANGLVIEDVDGNQFVWVPVVAGTFVRTEWIANEAVVDVLAKYQNGKYSEQEMQNLLIASWGYESLAEFIQDENEYGLYEDEEVLTSWNDLLEHFGYDLTTEWFEENLSYYTLDGISEPATEDNSEYQDMVISVAENGGFYIGRYEAGSTTERTSSSVNTTMVIQQDAFPYNYVPLEDNNGKKGVVTLSRELYTENEDYGVTSTLCYGVQWDAVLRFAKDTNHNVTNSTTWGNYYNNQWTISRETAKYSENRGSSWSSAPKAKESDGSILLTTGASNIFSAKNIYDLAGNLCEWTMEAYSSRYHVIRGGYYSHEGGGWNAPVASRISGNPASSSNDIGFRVALYL